MLPEFISLYASSKVYLDSFESIALMPNEGGCSLLDNFLAKVNDGYEAWNGGVYDVRKGGSHVE
jgi:hypothetical protein